MADEKKGSSGGFGSLLRGAASAIGIDITDDGADGTDKKSPPISAAPTKVAPVTPAVAPSPAPLTALGALPIVGSAPFTDDEMQAANAAVMQVTQLGTKEALKGFLSTERELAEDIPDDAKRFRSAARLTAKGGKPIEAVITEARQVLEVAQKAIASADQAHGQNLAKIEEDTKQDRERLESEINRMEEEAAALVRALQEKRQGLVKIEQRAQEQRALAERQSGAFKSVLTTTVQRCSSLLTALQSTK